MPKDDHEIKRMLQDGINVSVSARDYDYYTLKRLAREAREGRASLSISDCDKLERSEMRRISEEGEDSVTFDFPHRAPEENEDEEAEKDEEESQ